MIGQVRALTYGGWLNGNPNREVAYVGTILPGELFVRESRKTDTGADFQLRKLPVEAGAINGIVLDPSDWHTAYVIDDSHVWMTTDAGVKWTPITGNLADLTNQFNTIELARGVLLVGTADGVYRTFDRAKPVVWSKFGGDRDLTKNLPNVQVSDLHYDAKNDVLIAGTFGRGAWVVKNASKVLTADPVLTINIDDDPNNLPNVITLKRDADNDDKRVLDVRF